MIDGSVRQIREHYSDTAVSASLDYAMSQTHDERVKHVRRAVDFACNLLEQHKSKKQNYNEDQISLEICEMLQMAGFPAEHDAYTNGHCDIRIKGKEMFLWLAEAKSHSSYEWLDQGFQQISTRYSTGVVGQDCGDILIYCKNSNSKAMLDMWKVELVARNCDVVTDDPPCENPMTFNSIHKHASTGLDFHIRHKVISLYWRPNS